jgi:hypothetical protein
MDPRTPSLERDRAACGRIASRLRAEQGRLALALASHRLDAVQVVALNAVLLRLQRAARLAERPETLDAALAMLEPALRVECAAMRS